MGGFGAKVVESPQRLMNILSLKKTGSGTPAISGTCASWFSVVDNGTGDYNINPTEFPFAQTPEVFVQVTTDNRVAKLGTVSTTGIQILTEDLSGNAAEGDFHLLVVGSLARDLIAP